jgi:hypothetical protein
MLFFNSSALYLASRKSKGTKTEDHKRYCWLLLVLASMNREGSLQVGAILFLFVVLGVRLYLPLQLLGKKICQLGPNRNFLEISKDLLMHAW